MKKFAATNMIRAKAEPTYGEYMLSHLKRRKDMGVGVLEMVYDRPEDSDLLREYIKAIHHLTVSSEERNRIELVEAQRKLSEQEALRVELEQQKRRIEEIKS